MIQIDVVLPDRPGEHGKLAKVLGDAGVNIITLSAESGAGQAYVSLIADQPVAARAALKAAGYECKDHTVLVVRIEDKPGALAALTGKLGAAGVNITSIVHLATTGGYAQLAIGVDNLAKARTLV